MAGETQMKRMRKRDLQEYDAELYDKYSDDFDDDFEDEFDDEIDSVSDLSRDFYSTDWEDPSGPKHRVSARRQIERRNELKDLISEFDDWDDYDLRNEW